MSVLISTASARHFEVAVPELPENSVLQVLHSYNRVTSSKRAQSVVSCALSQRGPSDLKQLLQPSQGMFRTALVIA